MKKPTYIRTGIICLLLIILGQFFYSCSVEQYAESAEREEMRNECYQDDDYYTDEECTNEYKPQEDTYNAIGTILTAIALILLIPGIGGALLCGITHYVIKQKEQYFEEKEKREEEEVRTY